MQRTKNMLMNASTKSTSSAGRVAAYVATAASFARTVDSQIDGLSGVPAEGSWSTVALTHHVADMELVSALRIRQAIACPGSMVGAVDQDEWEAMLSANRTIATSILVLTASRSATAELLRSLTDEQWNNTVLHESAGAVSVHDLVEGAIRHVDEHRATLQALWFQQFLPRSFY
jgi:DinB superfamily